MIGMSRITILVWTLFAAVTLRAQDYGALQYMLQKRPANEKFTTNRWNEHLFLSAGIGPYHLLSNAEERASVGMNAYLFVGKWFTPVHGFRLGVNMAYMPTNYYNSKIKQLGGSLDYLMNMSALAYGYNEKRVFELIGVAGLDAGYSRVEGRGKLFGGGHLGLQGSVRLSPSVDLFVEPRIGWANDALTHADSWRNYRMTGTVLAGLTYMPTIPIATRNHTDEFDRSSFWNHTFVSFSSGVNVLKVPGIKKSLKGAGPHFTAAIGKWFSPSSGLRLSGVVGYGDTPAGSESNYLKHVDARADYLLNVTNVLWGYDEDRFFTLSGVAGVNVTGVKGTDKTANYLFGAGVGMQGSFRLNRSVDLFVEPRLNVYGKRYAGGRGYFNSDQLGELNIGLTYHATDRRELSTGTKFTGRKFTDNLFMTTGLGAQLFVNKTNLKKGGAWGPIATATLGKWLSPSSGLRLVGTAGYFGNYTASPRRERHAHISAGIDYLWNITSTMSGYNPERVFELIGSAGVNFAYTSKSTRKWTPGLDGGLQGIWHLNDFLGLYLEPQVRVYGDKMVKGNLGFMQKDVLFSLSAGLHYRFAPYSKAAYRSRFIENDRRMFVSVAGGASGMFVANKDLFKRMGTGMQVSVGKWFTPLSAWRVNGTVARMDITRSQRMHYAGVGVDYMMSLASLAKGYSTTHVIDVVPFVGATIGTSYRHSDFAVVPGIDAGAQLKFNVSRSLDLFIEPKVGIRADRFNGIDNGRSDRVVALLGGVTYKPRGAGRVTRSLVQDFTPRTFVSLGAGTGLHNNSASRNDFSFRTDLTIGRYFTPLSGIRLGVTHADLRMAGTVDRVNHTQVHADYLLDMTTLLNGYVPDRRFTLSGIVGVGLNTSSAPTAKVSFGGNVGAQAKLTLSKHFDLFVEPLLNMYNAKTDGRQGETTSLSANVLLGTMYRF